jgi:hypothetical protein
MLSAYSVLMMLLIVTGSLIGISSIYQPVNVETQPQPQPQKPTIGSKIIVPKTIDPTAQRALEDRQLLDRLMPEIIKRIDVKLVLTQRPGQRAEVDVTGTGIDSKTSMIKASCAPGESLVGGGMMSRNMGELNAFHKSGEPAEPNSWVIISNFDEDGSVSALAECLKVQLSLRPLTAHQPGSLGYLQEIPSQPRPPTQPPGGPPLQPPPEFGK